MNEPTPDVLHWYPMRVTYSRELQTKSFLESVGVECFIPMRYEQIDGRHPRHQELRPAIHNLIFVHASQSRITEMKMTRREMAPLRYMMRPVHDDKGQTVRHEIIVVPDLQMDNFMRVASVADDRVFFIENLDFAGKPGQHVRVVDGDFAGLQGGEVGFLEEAESGGEIGGQGGVARAVQHGIDDHGGFPPCLICVFTHYTLVNDLVLKMPGRF